MTTIQDTVFKPFKYGPLELKNRVVMAPMTRTYSPGNIPSDLTVEYYRKRAAGGVGLIISEGTCIGHPAANGYPNVPYFDTAEQLAGWKKVVDAVHAEGSKFFPQLWHVGSVRRQGMEPNPEVPGHAPSGMSQMPGKVTCHVMSEEDIWDTINAFAKAAKHAEDIGCDGVEFHGAHSYLVDQFFCPELNIRDDKWGGSVENRSRFAIEIVKAARKLVSPDFPLAIRWSQWKVHDFNYKLAKDPKELEEFLMPLVDAGIDMFHSSTRRWWEPEFEGSDLTLAGWVKKVTGKPSIAVGSVGLNGPFCEVGEKEFMAAGTDNIDNLVDCLEADEFDLVAVGRALIANPDWANQVRDNEQDKLVAYKKEMLLKLV